MRASSTTFDLRRTDRQLMNDLRTTTETAKQWHFRNPTNGAVRVVSFLRDKATGKPVDAFVVQHMAAFPRATACVDYCFDADGDGKIGGRTRMVMDLKLDGKNVGASKKTYADVVATRREIRIVDVRLGSADLPDFFKGEVRIGKDGHFLTGKRVAKDGTVLGDIAQRMDFVKEIRFPRKTPV